MQSAANSASQTTGQTRCKSSNNMLKNKKVTWGAPGWLNWKNMRPLISGSWVQAPSKDELNKEISQNLKKKKSYLDKRTLILYFADNDTNIAGPINKQWFLATKRVYLPKAAEAVKQTDGPWSCKYFLHELLERHLYQFSPPQMLKLVWMQWKPRCRWKFRDNFVILKANYLLQCHISRSKVWGQIYLP